MRGKSKFLVALVAAAGLVASAGPALASGVGGDWTQADHDASGNRANTTATQITASNASTVSWLRGFTAPAFSPDSPGCGEGWTTPVVVAKKAYAVASGRLTALDLVTGAQLWQRKIDPTDLSGSTVYAVTGGRVFVGQLSCQSMSDPLGSVNAYDAATGAPLWSQSVDGLVGVAVSGRLVLGAGSSAGSGDTLRVLDAATGAVVWQRLNTPTCGVDWRIVRDQVYYQDCNATGDPTAVVALRLADGVEAWRKATTLGADRGDRPGSDANVLVATNAGTRTTVVVDPATGANRFTATGMDQVDAVGTNRLFGSCGGSAGVAGTICAVDRATGARSWTSRIQAGFPQAPAASAATLLYLPSGQVLNSATGAVVTRLWTGQHSAVTVGNGYVVTVPGEFSRNLDVYGLPGT
jgi:outer membrane protein assembly factor BamB